MRALREFFEECSHATLTWIAVGITIFMIGGGSLVVGGIWIFWRFLDALHLPTMILFRGACWLFFWPGFLIERHREKPDELAIVMLSGFGWLITLVIVLNAGKFVFRRFEA